MAIVEEQLGNQSFSEDKDGPKVQRYFLVTELSGNVENRLFEACQLDEIPRRNTPHPSIPGILVDTRSASFLPDSNTKAFVTVTYKRLNPGEREPSNNTDPVINVGATVTATETNRDYAGNLITITYTANTTDAEAVTGVGTVEKQVPQVALSLQRREARSPLEKAIRFVGKLNRGRFYDGDQWTWLCTGIQGQSDDGGDTYTVTYEFAYNPETWDPTVVYIDPETDAPPVDPIPTEGNGLVVVPVYNDDDFGVLNL